MDKYSGIRPDPRKDGRASKEVSSSVKALQIFRTRNLLDKDNPPSPFLPFNLWKPVGPVENGKDIFSFAVSHPLKAFSCSQMTHFHNQLVIHFLSTFTFHI